MSIARQEIIRFLYLILTLSNFIFNGINYLQINFIYYLMLETFQHFAVDL